MSAIKELQITTNIASGGNSSGDVGLLYHMNPSLAGTFYPKTYQMADFWRLGNVVYDSAHKAPSFQGAYGSNTSFIADLYSANTEHYVKQLVWDYTGNPVGYAGYYTGTATDSSSGSTLFKCDIKPSYTGNVSITAKNALGSSHVTSLAVTSGTKSSFAIAWQCTSAGALPPGASASFTSSGYNFPHPCSQISLDPTGVVAGTIYMDYARYDDVVTAAQLNPVIIGGVQLAISKVASGTPDYSIYIGKLQINQTVVDGPVSDPKRYKGLPRWTYKWMGAGADIGYGVWRGPSGCGYSWLSGWAESQIFANGRSVSAQMMQFLKDAQDEYKVQFPAKQIGPFMPRYGRASWEALDTAGYVAGTLTASTYNKWYYPDTDDWYGYMYRALLSVARYYYLNAASVHIDPNAKVVLDNWMAWLDVYLIADGGNWKPPSDFYNDGTVGYTYRPVYAYACIAQACIYKYWVDGDAIALKWYRRMLDSMYAVKRMTGTGTLLGCSRTTEGQNFTAAAVGFSVNSGATMPMVTPIIAGGKIMRYVVNSAGASISSITAVVSGDGSGATCNPYLSNQLVGAFDANHTGWEVSEIFNTYALLVNGSCPGGNINYPTSATANDQTAFSGLITLYANNTSSARPSLRNAELLPLHEYDIDPYHNGTGIENPMYDDNHARGAMWTETLGPSLYAAVEYGRYTNSWAWLTNQFGCVQELIGLPSSSAYLTPTPRFSLGLADGYTDIIGGESMLTCKRGTYDSAYFTVDANKRIVIPASMGGGNATFIRGAWFPAVPFNWSGFKAAQDTTYGGDQKNYADVRSGATASNVYSGGVLSTVIQLSSIAVGSSLQAYYAYRDGTVSAKGQAMSGWPYLHVDPYQGTANDGDNYLMMALYHAWRVTGNTEYSDAADRIGAALLYGGCWNGNAMSFAVSLEEAGGQVGLYSYNATNTPFSMSNVYKAGNYGLNSLKIQARVWEAQSPASYAGIGLFPDWPISANEPFAGFEFSFCWD